MKKLLYIFIVFVSLSSCLRLDDNLFNQNKLSEYKLDNYTGEVDFILPNTYDIPSNLIHTFQLHSQSPSEASSTTIYAIYIGDIVTIATDTVIMYCHGNKDHMDFYWPRAKLLANTVSKNHYGVLMIDYRGYGMSEGKPTEDGLYADVDAAIKWLSLNGLTNDRLMMYGFSLGTAPATKISANTNYSMKPSKLILEAPFASAEVMVQDQTGLALPGTTVTDLKINNGEEIKKVQQPFLWIHGEADDFININTHGAVVYNNYNGSYKEGHRIANAGHSTIETTLGFQEYLQIIGNFIRR